MRLREVKSAWKKNLRRVFSFKTKKELNVIADELFKWVDNSLLEKWLHGKGIYLSHSITNGKPNYRFDLYANKMIDSVNSLNNDTVVFYPLKNPVYSGELISIDLALAATASKVIVDLSKPSFGAAMEIFFANQNGVRVVGVLDTVNVSNFALGMCSYLIDAKEMQNEIFIMPKNSSF